MSAALSDLDASVVGTAVFRRRARMEELAADPTKSGSFYGLVDQEMADDVAEAEAEAEALAHAEAKAQAKARVLQVEPVSLCLYLLLVGLLSAVIWLSRNGSYEYYFARMVRENVLHSEMDPADTEVATTFEDVATLEQIFQFLRGPFLAAVYVETGFAGRPLPPRELRRVNDANVLVGAVRLQQVRVRPDVGCSVDTTFAANTSAAGIGACYASWGTASAHDTSTIVGAEPAAEPAAFPQCVVGGAGVGTAGCAPNTYAWADTSVSGIGSFSGEHRLERMALTLMISHQVLAEFPPSV